MRRVIPGGAHTYAKGDDQWPEGTAPVIRSGTGCRVEDVDGNRYIEFGMGLRAVTLGHAHPAVIANVVRRLQDGQNFTRPAALELEVAEQILSLFPGADMIKFTKNGSDATTAAVRLARAATGRDLVAVCGTQPFFSVDDWFIGSTPMNAGIPLATQQLTHRFPYADVSALRGLLDAHPSQFAAVMLEPATWQEPPPGYLAEVAQLCRARGTVLVFDETITGFRWHLGGAQHEYGVIPDLTVLGKAMGNGFAIAALLGRRELMQLGGLDHAGPRVFLLSYTHGAEPVGLAAAEAVARIYVEERIVERLYAQGRRLADAIAKVSVACGVEGHVRILGRPCNLVYQTLDRDGQPSQGFRTLLLQELVRRGVLAPSLVVSAAHDDVSIDAAIEAIAGAMAVYRCALDDGLERYLEGRPVQPVMRARN